MESILGFFFSSATIQGTLQLEPLMVKFLKWQIWHTFFIIFYFLTMPQACGIQFPDQGMNLHPLHWKCRVVTTGPLGKSFAFFILEYHKQKNKNYPNSISQRQFSSVTQSCPTLCDPMDCHTPVFPVRHQLLEITQTHVHLVGDAIQPSHPLSSPSPPTFNLSQNQGLFQ